MSVCLLVFLLGSVYNKYHVSRCMDIPKYLPEITFGAQEFNDMTREFTEVRNPGISRTVSVSKRWKIPSNFKTTFH